MTEWLRDWILGMVGASMVCAAAAELTPKGPVKGVVKTMCGVVLASALLGPLLRFDFPSYALHLARARSEAAAVTARAGEISSELDRRVIEERTRAYILDKAKALGSAVTDARVTLEWSTEGFWYPTAAELDGEYHRGLSELIAAELGIGRGAQTWKERGADGPQ
ncbi:MAG: hypothetical protein IJ617_09525 [Oscillospiraceae bacterium]|nr:hypothetical protein [Oscillospiraceae bacterium]